MTWLSSGWQFADSTSLQGSRVRFTAILCSVGCPEGDAFAVYQMAQLSWVSLLQFETTQVTERDTVHFSYVDNWLYCSHLFNDLKIALDCTHDFQSVAGFKISPSKTWVASTSPLVRGVMKGWSWGGCVPQICMSKRELGMVLRFSRSQSVSPAAPRWEDGLHRATRLIHKDWTVQRKISVVRQGIFPTLFSGCETVHVWLSTFRTIRARLNSAVLGKGSISSHLLSPSIMNSSFMYLTPDWRPFGRLSYLLANFTLVNLGTQCRVLTWLLPSIRSWGLLDFSYGFAKC